MNCSCCCTNILDFCKQDICGDGIDFDIKAQLSGIHTLVLNYLGNQIRLSVDFDADENIIFPTESLNENYQYTGELYDPLENKIVIRKNDVDYDCIKFKTNIMMAV